MKAVWLTDAVRFGTAQVEPLNPWRFIQLSPTRPEPKSISEEVDRETTREIRNKPRRLTIRVLALHGCGYLETQANISLERQGSIDWGPLDIYTL